MKILLDERGSSNIWAIISLSISMMIASFLFYRVEKIKILCGNVLQKIESTNIFMEDK